MNYTGYIVLLMLRMNSYWKVASIYGLYCRASTIFDHFIVSHAHNTSTFTYNTRLNRFSSFIRV
jgi:hypothetical protein